jgi:hypothetical protein
VLKLAQRCSTPLNSNLLELLNPTQPYSTLLKKVILTCKIVSVCNASRAPEYPYWVLPHILKNSRQTLVRWRVKDKECDRHRSPPLAAAWLYALAAPDTGKRQLSTCACPSHLTQSWRVGSVCFLLGPRFPKIGSSPGTRASSEEANATRRRTNEGYILNDRLLGLTDPFHRSDSA